MRTPPNEAVVMRYCRAMLVARPLGFLFLAGLVLPPAWPVEPGRLRVEIRERASGATIPARVYLTDGQGKLHAPPDAIAYNRHEEHHFISNGTFSLSLPAGSYSLSVERGLEYLPWSTQFALAAGETKIITAPLERWINMNQRGWYSGDLHNHRKPDEMSLLLLAEDLNLAPTLTDLVWEGRYISRAPAGTEPIRRVDDTHVFSVLDQEVERLNHGPGAVDLLALKAPVPFEGDWLYPPNDFFCRRAREQGGYVDAEKITWRDVPALVALGHIDFAGVVHNHFNRHGVETETEPWGMAPKDRPEYHTPLGLALWTLHVYYRFLNCGFRLPASAGSASGVKAAPLGYNRVYVQLDGAFSYQDWFRALKAGRNFATNGPLLFLAVNGRAPGSVIELPAPGATLKIRAEARTAGEDLERVEIIFKGQVVKTAEAGGAARALTAELDLPAGETGWVAARAFERPSKTIRYAQASPVYVRVGNTSGIVPQDAQYFLNWMRREKEFYRRETRFQSPRHQEAMVTLFEQAEAVYARLAGSEPR